MNRPARPLIAIPARFSASCSALRYGAEVNARALIEAVWRGGGEPATIHPHAPGGSADPGLVADRLSRFDGILLPGGGDLSPSRYGVDPVHGSVHDIDAEQDGFDLAVARQALHAGLPLLAICRGVQVVNVALGGTLAEHQAGWRREHRNLVHQVDIQAGSALHGITGSAVVTASCYHHQRVDRMGAGLTVTAKAADGTSEAFELLGRHAWFIGVQWHPEDTALPDPVQQALFNALVQAARQRW
ncbi:gamma-glutamyl-gamma-aminobutyrate hydrolase family protein [Streptomyces sp. p1417]|uniref:Gamma-glutamyl-gamma-aminobutyrate hydrolase family protein n=1 Tax=Streptomyces typhae TaxID=2681492 RepID=A0A6L6X4Q7_9ACTN|nr:gamma-glutamyl-gamma-aminobutyrate hydrolase family protein [Streptomyces typhae]